MRRTSERVVHLARRRFIAGAGVAVLVGLAPCRALGQAQAIAIDGFRSARFGADEAAVLAALGADFGFEGAAVARQRNEAERTEALSAVVADLHPGGRAQLAYIFGYRSKRLTQVNIVWGAPADPEASAERLAGTGVLLRNYFASQAFAPGTVRLDQALGDGSVLFFQGDDAKGRQAALHLSGWTAGGRRVFSLRLAYIADPKTSDVYRG